MIDCPACGYPSDEYEHRCERCGRRFDAPRLRGTDYEEGFFDPDENRFAAAEDFSQEIPNGDDLPPWDAEAGPAGGRCPDGRPSVGQASGHSGEGAPAAAIPAPTPQPESRPAPAPPQWKGEIPSRIRSFRQRRASQCSLPFDEVERSQPAQATPPARGAAASAAAGASSSSASLPPPAERETKVIPFEQIAARAAAKPGARESAVIGHAGTQANRDRAPAEPVLRFPEPHPEPRPAATPDSFIEVEVAPLAARALAAAYDGAVLAAGAVVFLGAYTLVGGRFPLQRAGLAALAASLGLVAAVFLLFCLYFSDSTPGLRWLSLRLVDFDGAPASRDRRLLRMLGMIMSALALGLGFLWALADEDGLTWHDRISRTCLTMTGSFLVRRPGR